MIIMIHSTGFVEVKHFHCVSTYLQIPEIHLPEIRFVSEGDFEDVVDKVYPYLVQYIKMRRYKKLGWVDNKPVYKEVE